MAKKRKGRIRRVVLGVLLWLILVIIFASIGTALGLGAGGKNESKLYSIVIAIVPIVVSVMIVKPKGTKPTEPDERKAPKKKISKRTKIILGVLVGCAMIGAVIPDTTEENAMVGHNETTTSYVETSASSAEATETTIAPETVATTIVTEPEDTIPETEEKIQRVEYTYTLNTNSKKFHYSTCSGAEKIKDSNRGHFTGTREEAIQKGYDPCGICKP